MSGRRRYQLQLEASLPGPKAPFVARDRVEASSFALSLDEPGALAAEELVQEVIRARRRADLPADWQQQPLAVRNRIQLQVTFSVNDGSLPESARNLTFAKHYESDLAPEAWKRVRELVPRLVRAAER